MITGPDVSSNQPHPINWPEVKAAGHTFVVVKATEGSTYVNPFFLQDVRDARAAGLVTWPYHWVSPATQTSGSTQGQHAVAVISKVFTPGDLVWLDFEQAGVTHATLEEARTAIEAAGFRTGTYTFPDFWSRVGDPTCRTCGSRPLWWADYNASHNRPAPAPWDHVALRQTDGTSVAVPGIGGLQDMSRAEVDLRTLTHSPTPAPTPTVQEDDMALLYVLPDGVTQIVADTQSKRKVANTTDLAYMKSKGMVRNQAAIPLTTGSPDDVYLRGLPWATP